MFVHVVVKVASRMRDSDVLMATSHLEMYSSLITIPPVSFLCFTSLNPPPPSLILFFFNGSWRRLSMNGRALSFLGPMTQLQGELLKGLLIDQIHHGSPSGDRQEEVRCIIGF